MTRVDPGGGGPPISSVPMSWVTSLSQLLQPWTDALNDLSSSAQNNLNLCTTSLTTFQNNCKVLVGDNTLVFQGLGAKAFDNLSTLNQGKSMLVNAKMNDFYNASHNLASEITNLNSQYELGNGRYYNDGGGGFPNPIIYQFVGNMDYDDILKVLMDGFLTNTSVDSILNPNTISSTISAGTQIGLNQMTNKIDAAYQALAGNFKLGPTEDPHDHSGWKERLSQIKQDYQTALEIVQGLTTNMNTQLEQWALALNALASQYAQEVSDAAQMDRATVADYIYEANQPAYAHQNVLIWPLPNGGLFIMIRGGDPQADEQVIKNYLATYGQQGKTPLVTIMGYEGGMGTAQQIITDSQNPSSFLDFQVVNAIMVGDQNKLPDQQTPGINYVDYALNPDEKKAWSFLGLNEEQVITMGVTTLVSLALEQPELVEGEFASVFGKLGTEKLVEYATSLGFNASESGGETPAQYLIQWSANHNQDQIQLPNGKWMPMQDYVQQQISQGGLKPLSIQGVNHRFDYTYTVPEEANMKQDLTKSSYLGSQFILDPNAMNQIKEGVVTLPPITNLPPTGGS